MSDATHGQPRRWDSLDFWRGYLLCTIFINHVPGNAFEPLTQKNFGFSDSAEGFVFVSGVSLALAYGRRLAAGGWAAVTLSLMRRSGGLYGVHILLSLLGLAVFAAGAAFLDTGSLLQMHGRDLAITAPGTMLLGVVSLGHQFGYFNILPMYILMIVAAPAWLWLGRTSPWPMLAASFTLYAIAVTRGWNLPTWPESGAWFFDPFAWQFLMVIGMAVGQCARRRPLPKLLPWTAVATVIVAFGAFSVTNGFSYRPGVEHWTQGWADLDKTTLGCGRLIHFLAVAYLLYVLRVADRLRGSPVFAPLCAIGRNSLWMFALLSLMAAAGQVLTQRLGHNIMTDLAMIAAGLVTLAVAAHRLDKSRGIARLGPSARDEKILPPAGTRRLRMPYA